MLIATEPKIGSAGFEGDGRAWAMKQGAPHAGVHDKH